MTAVEVLSFILFSAPALLLVVQAASPRISILWQALLAKDLNLGVGAGGVGKVGRGVKMMMMQQSVLPFLPSLFSSAADCCC